MKLTIVSIVIFGLFISASYKVTEDKGIEKSTQFCTADQGICIELEKGELSSKISIDNVTSFTVSSNKKNIDCVLAFGRINFDNMCSKDYLLRLLRSGNVGGASLTIPEIGIEVLELNAVISLALRWTILVSEAFILFILDLVSMVASIISGLFGL